MKKSLFRNLIWKFSERILSQAVTLIVSIILARLLEPQDYGIIAMVTIFITLAEVFVNEGFGSALIQKKDADELDFSTALIFNMALSGVLYLLLYIASPYIADFYGPEYGILVPVLRVLGLRLMISAVNSIQLAQISRNMEFHKSFLSTISGTVCSAVVGITMAYSGWGVWALVAQYLTNAMINTVALRIVIGTFPKLRFSGHRLKAMLQYGIRILGTSLLNTGFVELRALIIGKMYSSASLAYYDKAKQFPNLIAANTNTTIATVLFPRLSLDQDNPQKVKQITRKAVRFSSYLMFPLMLGFAAVAEPFVRVVLTEKWISCVPMLQLFCVVYLFQPIHLANLQAIKAMGRSDLYLKLESFKKVIELAVLLLTISTGVTGIVLAMAVTTTVFTFVNAYPNAKLINYPFREQMKDILPSLVISSVMAVVVVLVGFLSFGPFVLLVLQVATGVVIYLLLSVMTGNKEFVFIVDKLSGMLRK